MKSRLKTTSLLILSAILFALIFFIDATFYFVPSFIKVFQYERELTVFVAFLCIYPVIKGYYKNKEFSIQKSLLQFTVCLSVLILFLTLPSIILKKYLTLWDNNPFLAEFPLAWNITSSLSAIFTMILMLNLLLISRELTFYQREKYTDLFYNLLIFVFFAVALTYNFFENRYTFEPLSLKLPGTDIVYWILIAIIAAIFFLNCRSKDWIEELNKKEKYIALLAGIILLGMSIYLYFSPFIMKVYAYSISVKGFIIASFGFIILNQLNSFFRLVLFLPGAAYYDRVNKEVKSFGDTAQLIKTNQNINGVLTSIVHYACEALEADFCWIDIFQTHTRKTFISHENIAGALKKTITSDRMKEFHRIIKNRKKEMVINNSHKDNRTSFMKIYNIPWQSLIAIPLFKNNEISGILYAGKRQSYAFHKRDVNTLKIFMLQTEMAMKSYEADSENKKAAPRAALLKNNVFPGKSPELDNFQIDVIPFITSSEEIIMWDYLPLAENKLAIIQASIKGNPLDAIPIISELKGIINTLFKIENNLDIIIDKSISIFNDSTEEYNLKNVELGILDIEPGKFRLASNTEILFIQYKPHIQILEYFNNISEECLEILPHDLLLIFPCQKENLNKERLQRLLSENSSGNHNDFIDNLQKNKNEIYKNTLLENKTILIIKRF